MKTTLVLLLFLATASASAQWDSAIDTVTSGGFNDIDPQVDHAGMAPGLIDSRGYGSVPDFEWVIFERWDGTGDAIAARMFSGTTLKWDSRIVTISAETAGVLKEHPDVCTVGNGTSVAAWQQKSGGVWNIYYSTRSSDSLSWSAPAALTVDSVSSTNAEVRPLSDSSLVVIWKRNDAILFSVFRSGLFSGIDTLVTSNTGGAEYDFSGGEFVWTDSAASGNDICLVGAVQETGTLSVSAIDTVDADGDMSNPRFMIYFGSPGHGFTFNLLRNGRLSTWEAASFGGSGWSISELAGGSSESYLNGVSFVPMQLTSSEPAGLKTTQTYFGGYSAWERISGTDTSVVFDEAGTDSVQQGSNPSISSLTFSAGGKTFRGFVVWQSGGTGNSQLYSRSFGWSLDAVNEPAGPPTAFRLDQNYPNPFNPTTVIQFVVPTSGFVSLKVYDVLGREVATLFDGRESAGTHSVVFNGSKFASGVYFYRLTAPGADITRKMMLVK